MKVAVVGGGIAGTAAAHTAAKLGAEVCLVRDRPGATVLSSGALDKDPWDEAHPVSALDADLSLLSTELSWVIGPEQCRVATPAGVARPARGRDVALLDLEPLAGKRVAVVDELSDHWDGQLVARALSDSTWARATHTLFEPVALELRVSDAERRFSAYDFASLHDEPKRFERLALALERARGSHDAFLLGPWLGVETDVAERLRERLELPLGESTSPPGGPAGARFERARTSLLEQAGVQQLRARVTALTRMGERWSLALEGQSDPLVADRVVLAVGGVAVGGIVLDPARPPHPGGACFHLSFEAPLELELDGAALDRVSTLHGVDFTVLGLGILERVGVAVEGVLVRGAQGVAAAGDCVAGRPRTMLEAMRAGIAAARALVQ